MAKTEDKHAKVWWKHWILIEIYKAAALGLILLLFINIFLKFLTRHNQELVVPDLSGLTVEEAEKAAKSAHLRIEVSDSLFLPKLPKGTIFRQSPHAGNLVKKNRRILLTINSIEAKQIVMPSVIGFSLRQAKAELSIRNLHVGKLIYVHDMATNNVLAQRINGKYISPGTLVDSESEVDLEVGISSDMETTFIPNVIGLNITTAKDLLIDNSLNIGQISYDASIKSSSDSLVGFVVKQEPDASEFSTYQLGTKINLFLSTNKTKIQNAKSE